MAARSPLPQHPPAAQSSLLQQQPAATRSPSTGSYFQYHQPTPQHPPQRTAVDEETLSNTLANSQIASPLADNSQAQLQVQNRQPKFTEEWDASVRGSSIIDGPAYQPTMQRSASISSRPEVLNTTGDGTTTGSISLSRGNTLKKKSSLRRSGSRGAGSIRRSSSRRSMKAGSVRSLALQSSHDPEETQSAFFCPVPTTGNPTEVLSNRFQTWRKILKDLIAYFREIQNFYEHRGKSLLKLANVLNNTSTPPGFLASGGLDDALQILRNYHKTAILESNKAREIEEDVILALTGLRSDLGQKMKEIKGLSGDFKNSVEKEMDNTRRAVNTLQDVLGQNELDSSLTTGKQDPYLLRLAVDRQVERQIDEENYLHQAYLNLETSGRELESIVVGEIQKSYNAYAGILKRESDAAYNAIDELRVGPIAMPKDHEWVAFVQRDNQFVDPEMPVRLAEHIHYPGRDHFACQEIRAGLLERKSKYLKSYTAGWYVLSPTHLHEFKSADKSGAPIMSLFLPEQKVGSHSTEGGSSNKFILKGRQTGSMHRGHTWVFRAESHDTMMAWYEDIKALTEKSPEERSQFVRGHARTLSRSSQRSVSSDGMVDDEDDEPFVSHENAAAVMASPGSRHDSTNRPAPGGRFPSDLQVNAERGMQVPLSPSSQSSGFLDNHSEYAMRGGIANGNRVSDYETIAAAGALPGSGVGEGYPGNRGSQLMVGQNYGNTPSVNMDTAPSHAALLHDQAAQDGVNPYSGEPATIRRNSSHRFSEAPIVVANTHVNQAENREVSQEFGNNASYPGIERQSANVPAVVDYGTPDYGNPNKAHVQAVNPVGNGYATRGGDAYAPNGYARPAAGRRMDSTPHVPGEYPRSTPAQTPSAF
ncbi:putative PH domain-containing protein [Seiridium unicorne]|uniref:PH domain-containing protein n=1 Tax=Seiridium unicorne TaxID=138068 RepID=A0ABR2UMS4_9PEZI